MSLRQEKKIFLIDLLCLKLDLFEQFGFGYSWWRFSNSYDLWVVPAALNEDDSYHGIYVPVLYLSRRSCFCGGSTHTPCPFIFLFGIPLVSEVAHVMKSLSWSSGSSLGPAEGGCRAVYPPCLRSPCTLLSLGHTGAREASVTLRAASPKVLQFPSQILNIYFSRAFPISTPWHLHATGWPAHVHFVHLGRKKSPQPSLRWRLSWFQEAVDGN